MFEAPTCLQCGLKSHALKSEDTCFHGTAHLDIASNETHKAAHPKTWLPCRKRSVHLGLTTTVHGNWEAWLGGDKIYKFQKVEKVGWTMKGEEIWKVWFGFGPKIGGWGIR